MTDVATYFKAERGPKSKGRARPYDPLADRCEVGVFGVCTIRPEHRHHVLPRSAGGTDEQTIDCCSGCHDYVHSHPEWAYTAGFLLHRSVVA